MVLPIGFFAPLPLAIMIPFMAAQSFAMGQAFGTSFQYGKRKISSMSNEEFNKTSPTILHSLIQSDIRQMIPEMNQSFLRMQSFQIDILESMFKTVLLAGQKFAEFVTGGSTSTTDPAGGGGTFVSDVLSGLGIGAEATSLPSPELGFHEHGDEFDTTAHTISTTLNANEKWASKWFRASGNPKGVWNILSLKGITKKELAFLITLYIEKKLPKVQQVWGKTFEAKWKKLTGKKLTAQDIKKKTTKAIEESGAKGKVKTISTMWAQLTFLLNTWLKNKTNANKVAFQNFSKKFNQYVASKGQPKLQINSEKSMQQGTLVPK